MEYLKYDAMKHFDDWLDCIQGNGQEIPDDVYEQIVAEIEKAGAGVEAITHKHVKQILRNLRLFVYYEHTNAILNRLTGLQKPPPLPDHMVQEIRRMYEQYNRFYNDGRARGETMRSRLPYSYCIKKMIQILEHRYHPGQQLYDNLVAHLKSREKMRDHEGRWKQVCEALDWEFIAST